LAAAVGYVEIKGCESGALLEVQFDPRINLTFSLMILEEFYMTDLTHTNTVINTPMKITTSHSWLNDALKRAMDIVVSLAGLICLSPILALIAFFIKRDSPGPVFYWGPRIGRYGRIFRMLKFRTMYESPKSYRGPRVTSKDDDRITPLGKWLRDTKLNELPQLWNVLIGEMSLVGPRPEDPSISKTWPIQIARELLSVRPGITSPASIVYRDEESMLQAEEVMRKYLHELSPDKMRLDQLYIRYRSFWLDFDVLFWTALVLVPKFKAYSPPEHLLYVGPITRLMQRYLSWFVWDTLIVFASISFTDAVVRLFGPLNIGELRTLELALGFSLMYSLVGVALRSDRIYWPKASSWESVRLGIGWFVVTAIVLGITSYLGFASLRIYGVILISSIFSLTGIIFIRYQGRLTGGLWSRILTHRLVSEAIRERVLIVGSGRTAEQMAWLLDHPTYSSKFQVEGFIDDDLRSQGMKIYGSKVIGRINDVEKIVKQHDVGLIILADYKMSAQQNKEIRNIANNKQARVLVAPDIFGSLGGLVRVASDTRPVSNLNDN
jgi:lipopolysaccharide/colanic/teichoic acid biosynthesis glycosyltransferase